MAWTGIHYEKWLGGDNSINIQGRVMVIVHCPSPHCHLSIYQVLFKLPLVVLKLFAGQGTGRMDGQRDGRTDRQTKQRQYASPFGEHKK